MVAVITREALIKKNMQRRSDQIKEDKRIPDRQKREWLETLDGGQIPTITPNFKLSEVVNLGGGAAGALGEFVGTGDYPTAWFNRQRYEVEAGRDEEPLLFPSIYNVVRDPNLEEAFTIYTQGDGGVVFEQVREGGEIKFSHVTSGSKTVRINVYATGLEYSEQLIRFNRLFQIAVVERQAGKAYNALLNHAHLSPILDYSYTSDNITDGSAMTTEFRATDSMPLKYLKALEAAMVASKQDSTNPRRGPYAILAGTAAAFEFERVLNRVPQQGFDQQSSAIDMVQAVIAYDGWSGTRGKKPTSYSGVGSTYAYLVNLGFREMDFQSFFKVELERKSGNADVSRLIMEQERWSTWFGLFADPGRAVHRITLPTSASGGS